MSKDQYLYLFWNTGFAADCQLLSNGQCQHPDDDVYQRKDENKSAEGIQKREEILERK